MEIPGNSSKSKRVYESCPIIRSASVASQDLVKGESQGMTVSR